MNRILKSNKGEVMIEAAIYFPIIFLVIMMCISLSLIKVQDAIIEYQINKIANNVANSMTYSWYGKLDGTHDVSLIDEVSVPSAVSIQNEARKCRNMNYLYNPPSVEVDDYSGIVRQMSERFSLFSSILLNEESVTDHRGYGERVIIRYGYYIDLPEFIKELTNNDMKYLGIRTSTVAYGTNPTELTRISDAAENKPVYSQYGIGEYDIAKNYLDTKLRYKGGAYDE